MVDSWLSVRWWNIAEKKVQRKIGVCALVVYPRHNQICNWTQPNQSFIQLKQTKKNICETLLWLIIELISHLSTWLLAKCRTYNMRRCGSHSVLLNECIVNGSVDRVCVCVHCASNRPSVYVSVCLSRTTCKCVNWTRSICQHDRPRLNSLSIMAHACT